MVAISRPVQERVLAKLDRSAGPDGCWTWLGRVNQFGYGYLRDTDWRHRRKVVHLALYEALVGPLAEGMVLDHVCHPIDGSCPGGRQCLHRRCANLKHLRPVTRAANTRRRVGLVTTHFNCGHPVEGNTKRSRVGKITCLRCARAHRRAFYQRQKPLDSFRTTHEIPAGVSITRGQRLEIK